MNKTFFYLNITIRVLIILTGLMIEFNIVNLPEVQYQSILWIGRAMIGFGLIRLAWLMYQVHVQSKDDTVSE